MTLRESIEEELIKELKKVIKDYNDTHWLYVEEEGEKKFEQFILQTVIPRVRESVADEHIKEALSKLPRVFWEDEDHSVGGYISKKELFELVRKEEK